MLCQQRAIVNRQSEKIEGSTLRCNRWSCDYCRPFKQRELKRLARAGEPDTFITLTSGQSDLDDPNERACQLVRAWRLVVKRAKRKFGIKKLPYITVIEATKAGQPHLHILARVDWIPQKWLSAQMAELIQSPIVWIERIKGKGKIIGYIAKYIGKEPHKFAGCKRYWRSLDWICDKAKWIEEHAHVKGAWNICNYSIVVLADSLLLEGYSVVFQRPNYFIAEPGR